MGIRVSRRDAAVYSDSGLRIYAAGRLPWQYLLYLEAACTALLTVAGIAVWVVGMGTIALKRFDRMVYNR